MARRAKSHISIGRRLLTSQKRSVRLKRRLISTLIQIAKCRMGDMCRKASMFHRSMLIMASISNKNKKRESKSEQRHLQKPRLRKCYRISSPLSYLRLVKCSTTFYRTSISLQKTAALSISSIRAHSSEASRHFTAPSFNWTLTASQTALRFTNK